MSAAAVGVSAEYKKGKLTIEFAILKDGSVAGMKLVADSGDTALDRAAWGGITGSNPFPPLPPDFITNGGNYLACGVLLCTTWKTIPTSSDLANHAVLAILVSPHHTRQRF